MMKKWRKFASIGLTAAMLCSVVTGGISVLAEGNGIDDSKEYEFVFAEHVANVEEQAPQVYAVVRQAYMEKASQCEN